MDLVFLAGNLPPKFGAKTPVRYENTQYVKITFLKCKFSLFVTLYMSCECFGHVEPLVRPFTTRRQFAAITIMSENGCILADISKIQRKSMIFFSKKTPKHPESGVKCVEKFCATNKFYKSLQMQAVFLIEHVLFLKIDSKMMFWAHYQGDTHSQIVPTFFLPELLAKKMFSKLFSRYKRTCLDSFG